MITTDNRLYEIFSDCIQQHQNPQPNDFPLEKYFSYICIESKMKRRLILDPDVVTRKEDGKTILFHSGTGSVSFANQTGAFILEQLDGKRTLNEVLQSMAKEFEIDDVNNAREELLDFVEKLIAVRFVEESLQLAEGL